MGNAPAVSPIPAYAEAGVLMIYVIHHPGGRSRAGSPDVEPVEPAWMRAIVADRRHSSRPSDQLSERARGFEPPLVRFRIRAGIAAG